MQKEDRIRVSPGFGFGDRRPVFDRLEDRLLLSGGAPVDAVLMPAQREVPGGPAEVLAQPVRVLESSLAAVLDAGGSPADLSTANLRVDAAGRIHVSVYLEGPTEDAVQALATFGLQDAESMYGGRAVWGWVHHLQLDALAGAPGVQSIAPPCYAVTNTGTVDTEGDEDLRSEVVREAFAGFGVDGGGVRIGVISDGIFHYEAVDGDNLPDLGDVTVWGDELGNPNTEPNEGSAMLEIVHDVAPGAQLFFAAVGSSADMVVAIQWMRDQSVDVIVDDLSFFDQPMFEDGDVAAAAQTAVDNGIVYVTAAGNYADKHYQDVYLPTSEESQWHDFDPEPGAVDNFFVVLTGAGFVKGALEWSDPWGASGNDYSLRLWGLQDSNWVSVDTSNWLQNGNGFPWEFVSWDNRTPDPDHPGQFLPIFNVMAWSFFRVSGNARELEFYTFGSVGPHPAETYTSPDSTFGQGAVEDVLSIGAIGAYDDPDYDTIEGFSSQGPSTIYTNFATQTSTARETLDGAGIDGVQTRTGQLGDFANPFFGTSAAAPHVAAIAALMLDANPTLTPAEVSVALTNTAVDLTDYGVGYDHVSGHGRFDALGAVYSVFRPDAPTLHLESDTGFSNQDGITSDTTPTFTGTAPAGAFLRLYVDGQEAGAQQLGAAETEYSITTPVLAEGSRAATIRLAPDASTPVENLSEESPSLAIDIDTTAPGGWEFTLDPDSDTGSDSNDGITRGEDALFTGTAYDALSGITAVQDDRAIVAGLVLRG